MNKFGALENHVLVNVTLLKSFYTGTLGIHACIAQEFQCVISITMYSRCHFKTAIIIRFLKVTMVMSNFMNIFNDRFATDFSFNDNGNNHTILKLYV